jgi:hypothetical protein
VRGVRRGYGWRRLRFCAWPGAIAALGLPVSAFPQEWATEIRTGPDPPAQEVWAGVDFGANAWALYSGVTLAPFGAVTADGWRLRLVGGYGAYDYRTVWALTHKRRTFKGAVSFAEALVGYQRQWGTLTVKTFVGVAAETQAVAPPDPRNEVMGYEAGVKAALETWLDITPRYWTSLDLSWTSVFNGYSARLRAGHRLAPDWSVGIEGAAAGNSESGSGRAGAFLRYTWKSGEIAVSGGSALDGDGAYATLNALYRY